MQRIDFNDLPQSVKEATLNLHISVVNAKANGMLPDITGVQVTIEPIDAESTPTFDFRTV